MKKNKILLIFLITFFSYFVFSFSQIIFTENVTVSAEDTDTEENKSPDYFIIDRHNNPLDMTKRGNLGGYGSASTDWMNHFDINQKYVDEIYNHGILQIPNIVSRYKACDGDEECLEIYGKMFDDIQKKLYGYGIGITVPDDGIAGWGRDNFYVWSGSEYQQGLTNKLYDLALVDSMAKQRDRLKHEYPECGDNQSCWHDKRQEEIDAITQANYDEYIREKELLKQQKENEKKLEVIERVKKALTDDDPSNDNAAIDEYCESGVGTRQVCIPKQDGDYPKAIEMAMLELDVVKDRIDDESEIVDEQLKEVQDNLKENATAKTLPDYGAGPDGKSQFLPELAKTANGNSAVIVAYDGLFTQRYVTDPTCQEGIDSEKSQFTNGNVGGEPTQGKIAKIFVDIIAGLVRSVVDVLFQVKCPGVSNADFSLITEVLNIAAPLNLTQNFIIMKLVGITQSLAYVVALALIVFYGVMYTTGYENMEPVKFGIRMFFAMILVYYLPYLMQDILNINNIIVHYLSQIKVTFDGNYSVSTVFAGAIHQWVTSMTESFLINLLTLILAIAMIVLAIQPIVKIFVWWYGRMLKIFFYAIIGPIMVVFMALPQTSDKASKWMKDFVGETFSQVFMILAMAMLAFIVGNMGDFQILTNIGWLGTLLVMYASIIFLSEIPELAKGLIGGISGLKSLGSQATQAAQKAGRGAKNTASGMKNAAKNVTAAASSGQRWSAMSSIKDAKGLGGKAGAIVGSMAAKAYTARDSKNMVGNAMNKTAKALLNKDTNFSPLQKSAHQRVNATVKPQVDRYKSWRENVHAKKAENYQEHANDALKKSGGDLTNMQTAFRDADTEARRGVAELLGKDGSVAGHKEMLDIATKNGGAGDAENNVIPNPTPTKTNGNNSSKGGTQTSKSDNNGGGQGATVTSNATVGSASPSGGGSGQGGQGATSRQTQSQSSGKANSEMKKFNNDAYKLEPMKPTEFQKYNEKMMKEESQYLTAGQTKLNGLKREQQQSKHEAAFYGPQGAGNKRNQPSYENMAQKIHGDEIRRADGSAVDKTQSFEDYLTRIGVSEGTAKGAASHLKAESESGQSHVASAINRAMSMENETAERKQQIIKEGLQQADLKGEAVEEVSKKIYEHESYLRESGKVSGKAEGDVVTPQTSSPTQTIGESNVSKAPPVETVSASTQKVKEEPSAQKQVMATEEVIGTAEYLPATKGELVEKGYDTEIIDAPKQSTSTRGKAEPVIIEADFEEIVEQNHVSNVTAQEELVSGSGYNDRSTPMTTEIVEKGYETEIIDAPEGRKSTRTEPKTVIVEADFEEIVEQSSTPTPVVAQEELMSGSDYTYTSNENTSIRYIEEPSKPSSNVDRTTKTEYVQPEETTSYEEPAIEVTDTPHRKQEMQRQEKLYEKALGRYQGKESVTAERIELEMRVSKKDARRIANKLNQRFIDRDDS